MFLSNLYPCVTTYCYKHGVLTIFRIFTSLKTWKMPPSLCLAVLMPGCVIVTVLCESLWHCHISAFLSCGTIKLYYLLFSYQVNTLTHLLCICPSASVVSLPETQVLGIEAQIQEASSLAFLCSLVRLILRVNGDSFGKVGILDPGLWTSILLCPSSAIKPSLD